VVVDGGAESPPRTSRSTLRERLVVVLDVDGTDDDDDRRGAISTEERNGPDDDLAIAPAIESRANARRSRCMLLALLLIASMSLGESRSSTVCAGCRAGSFSLERLDCDDAEKVPQFHALTALYDVMIILDMLVKDPARRRARRQGPYPDAFANVPTKKASNSKK